MAQYAGAPETKCQILPRDRDEALHRWHDLRRRVGDVVSPNQVVMVWDKCIHVIDSRIATVR